MDELCQRSELVKNLVNLLKYSIGEDETLQILIQKKIPHLRRMRRDTIQSRKLGVGDQW